MRHTLLRLLLISLCSCFNGSGAYAQGGWEWAQNNRSAFLDGWPIATDHSANVYVAGMTEGLDYSPIAFGAYRIPFSIALQGNQCVLAKYDSAGNFLWAVATQNGDTYLMSITTDKDDNIFMFGSIASDSVQIGATVIRNNISPAIQYFIVKFDPKGNVLWTTLGGSAPGMPGPAGTVFGPGQITTDATGNIYVTTSSRLPAVTVDSIVLPNSCPACATFDILLAKYDPDGKAIWATTAGGTGDDEAFGITVAPAKDIYISGVYMSSSITFGPSVISNPTNGWNGFIARYTNDGIPVWASGSGGTGFELADFATTVAADENNNVYLTGWVWDTTISYAGTTIVNPYPHNLVAYLVKFTPDNTVDWYKTIGCPKGGNSLGYSIAISPCAVWLGGATNNTLNIDGTELDTTKGSVDPIFIAGFNSAGKYIGSATLPSGGDDQCGIACDPQGNVYLCADYKTSLPFRVGKDLLQHDNKNIEQLYVAKYIPDDPDKQVIFTTHQDTSICLYSSPLLSAPGGYTRYLWDNGTVTQNRIAKEPGTYWVTCYGGCALVDTIYAINNNDLCGCLAAIPKAFTPNGDGRNDIFGPLFQHGCTVTDYSLIIVNRWGQKVFGSTDPTFKWNGTYWNINADLGVYQYYLQYTSGVDHVVYHFTGDVTLIR